MDLDTVGQTTADGFLVCGSAATNTPDSTGLQDFLPADTITFVRCGQPTGGVLVVRNIVPQIHSVSSRLIASDLRGAATRSPS